jgi:ribosomal protein S18 acetylase RimI-like enzyme
VNIRKATHTDASEIAVLLLLAMEDIIYHFIGSKDYVKARNFVFRFVQMKDNQYSYQNCWVADIDNRVVAALNIYDGTDLAKLRQPVLDYIREYYQADFEPEDETQAGEYYIDSLGVSEDVQGQGIGTQLLQHIIDLDAIQEGQVLGLLVDEENPTAKKLYVKLGFVSVGKLLLFGKKMERMQFNRPTSNRVSGSSGIYLA